MVALLSCRLPPGDRRGGASTMPARLPADILLRYAPVPEPLRAADKVGSRTRGTHTDMIDAYF